MFRSFARMWRESGKFRSGMTILFILIVLALAHSLISAALFGATDPLAIAGAGPWQTPGLHHLLGTDRYGRDILIMALSGLEVSLEVAAIAGVLSTLVGVVVAFVAGYKGGLLDSTLNTTTDMFLVVPSLPLLLALSAYVRNVTLFEVSVLLSIFSWPFAARTIRAQVLSLRSRPYVELARVTNLNDAEIIFQELLPNLLPYIGVGFATASLGAIFALVGLEVIGLGPGNLIDLGLMINWSITWGALSLGAWPIFVAPVVALSLLFISVNLINIGLEELYNPRLRGTAGA
jgi:peptide/nickel transport system permease protein